MFKEFLTLCHVLVFIRIYVYLTNTTHGSRSVMECHGWIRFLDLVLRVSAGYLTVLGLQMFIR